MTKFDVIVVGGGHAGIEAAYAAAKMGSKTLLLTLSKDKIAMMPCNPSLGGLGKGHIVFEVSAFGGLMPQLSTHTYLQARMLNTSKGPAVQGLRLQIDKYAYSKLAFEFLNQTPLLLLRQHHWQPHHNQGRRLHGHHRPNYAPRRPVPSWPRHGQGHSRPRNLIS